MSIAPTSADGSAAAWMAEAAGAAEAYVQAQADEAARLRDAQEAAAQAAQQAGSSAPPADGVDRPPVNPAHESFWGHDPNRPSGAGGPGSSNSSTTTSSSSSGSSGGGPWVVSDGNGGWIPIPQDNVNVIQQAEAPDFILPIGNLGGGSSSVQSPSTTSSPDPGPAAANGTNQVTTPVETEHPTWAAEVVTGLGPEVDAILNNSPTLREQWARLKAAGWEIEFTDKKSHTDYDDKRIRLNRSEADTLSRGVVLFSHELGHAVSGPQPQVTAHGRTKEDYVSRNVAARLLEEGSAAFENCRHREEIENWSDIDITIAGRRPDGPYLEIYQDFKSGRISEETAKYRMGQLAGEEAEYRDGTTKRQAYTAQEAQEYADEIAARP